jgi:hypothetical protein
VHPVRSVALWFTRRVDSFLGFCWKLVEDPNLGQPKKKQEVKPTNGYVVGWNCTRLSGQIRGRNTQRMKV